MVCAGLTPSLVTAEVSRRPISGRLDHRLHFRPPDGRAYADALRVRAPVLFYTAKKTVAFAIAFFANGLRGARTHDNLVVTQVLSQLS